MAYRLIHSVISDPEGRAHDTFGIKGKGEKIEDISLDKKSIKKLVRIFNRHKLEPGHLKDGVEDFLLKNCNRTC